VVDVLVVGAGRVGRTVGLLLALRGYNVYYLDAFEKVARAAAEDTLHAVACAGVEARVGWVREAVDADIVIVTASAKHGMLDTRMRLLEQNLKILVDVVDKVYPRAPKAWYVIVSNPVDVLATVFAKLTGTERVISTGTYIDSARFRVWLARRFNKPLSRVQGFVGGIHGEDLVVFWSTVRVDGERVRLGKREEQELMDYLTNVPWEIVGAIGMTSGGAGAMAAAIASMLASPTTALVAIAPYHEGACVGIPALLGSWSVMPREDILEEGEKKEVGERRRKVAGTAEQALQQIQR